MRRLACIGFVVGSVIAAAPRAQAAPYDFSAGSWIIPMDSCYQPSQPFNASSFKGTTDASTVYGSHGSCPDTSGATAKDGILKAYGLVYRLLQNGVPVYYILDTNKTKVDDPDLTLTGANVVKVINHSTWTSSTFMRKTTISYRGAPFIIAAGDVPTARNLLKTNSAFTQTDPRTRRGMFEDVYIHEAQSNILQAPVRALLNQTPPKIALLNIGNAANGVLVGYLQDAGLYDSTSVAAYPSIGTIITQFDNVSDFTSSNGLIAGGFSILWAPHWQADDTRLISSANRDAVTKKISDFVDAGHHLLAQCASVSAFEGSHDGTIAPDMLGDRYGYFLTNGSGAVKTLQTNQLHQSDFPFRGVGAIVVNPDPALKAWTDPLTQTGDFVLNNNATTGNNSYVFDFTARTGYAYDSYMATYVQSANTGRAATDGLSIETVGYKDGDSSKGLVIYLGGHSYGSKRDGCTGGTCFPSNQYNMLGLERLVLNSLIFLGQTPQSTEQTRSAPIVIGDSVTMPPALLGKTYLGSYVQQTQATAAYPPWQGHFREYAAGALSGANVKAFNAITPDWDAYDRINVQAGKDTGSNGTTTGRNIYTAVVQNGKYKLIDFTTANLTSIKTLAPTATAAQVTQIRQGALGGVDHSIPAIIGTSDIVSKTRPVVAYFGALDGMIHCILVNGTVSGRQPGDELWAFIPPSQLNKTFLQSAGVDGSPSVGDAFIIDPTGNGTNRAWRTLLAVPDGNYAGGTLDVLDVTDPTAPKFLWEAADTYTTGGKSYVLGRAQGTAISPVMTGSGVRFAYFLATDNTTGDAGNGFNMYALDAGDGSVIWRLNQTYANDTMHNDVPGTVAIIDAAGDGGPVTKVYFGDLEGKVWQVSATDGTGATAVFDAAATYQPANSVNYPIESGVVLYRDPTSSHLDAIGVTGSADWVPSATLSRVFKVDLTASPITATTLTTLATGERVYAVPTIADNSVYFITSFGGLQSAIGNSFTATGNLMRIELDSGARVTTLATVKQGASEVAVDANGNVIAASATGITQIGKGANDAQSTVALQNLAQKPMTVRAWLDLH